MVKLGEIVGSPKLLSVVKNIILNSLRTRLTENFPLQDVSGIDIGAERVFSVDWSEEASKAYNYRISQANGGREDSCENSETNTFYKALLDSIEWLYKKSITLTHYFNKLLQWRPDSYDFFVGKPLVQTGWVIIFVMIAHKRMTNNIALLILIAAFLLQANYIYVVFAYIVQGLRISLRKFGEMLFLNRKRAPLKRRKIIGEADQQRKIYSYTPETVSSYIASLGMPSSDGKTNVDAILIGNDFSTLYTAGILSQAGLKCVVLEPANIQPVTVEAKSPGLPAAYLESMSVGNPRRTQMLFENVFRIDGCSDSVGRIILRPLGNPAENFAHTIIKINNEVDKDEYIAVRPGLQAIMEDIYEAAGSTLPSNILKKLEAEKSNQVPSPLAAICQALSYVHSRAYPVLSPYLMQKVNNFKSNNEKCSRFAQFFYSLLGLNPLSRITREDKNEIQNLGTLSVKGLLSHMLQCHDPSSKCIEKCFSFISAVAATVGANEYLSPKILSSINIPYAFGQVQDGVFVPEGGYKAVANALYAVIRNGGGRVVQNVLVDTLLFDDTNSKRIVGLRIHRDGGEKFSIFSSKAVVSGLGAIHTHHMLRGMKPISCRDIDEHAKTYHDEPTMLLGACEARPKFYCIFWIKSHHGRAHDDISSYDYFEYPNYSVNDEEAEGGTHNSSEERKRLGYLTTASGSEDMNTGGVFIKDYVKIWSPTAKDPKSERDRLWDALFSCSCVNPFRIYLSSGESPTEVVIVELEAGDEVVRKVICPVYTKIPSDRGADNNKVTGAYACYFPLGFKGSIPLGGVQIILSEIQKRSVIEHARAKMQSIYPHLTATRNMIVEEALVTENVGGRKLSAVRHKFCAFEGPQVTAACEGFENMYLCSTDISFAGMAGSMQAGWIAANSILGFSSDDVLSGNNVFTNL